MTSQTPTYGFTISPGPQIGIFDVVTLIPNNVAGAGSEVFSVDGKTAFLEAGQWTSGSLAAFFGISATPNNPIGAYLPTTQAFDPGATGYFVYVSGLGFQTLTDPSNPSGTFSLSDGSFVLPLGTSIVGFFESSHTNSIVATANSGQLSIEGSTPPSLVPEPGSLALLSTGLLSMTGIVRRRFVKS